MGRADRIAREILSSERFAQSKTFKDRVYSDEPILRAGMRKPEEPRATDASSSQVPVQAELDLQLDPQPEPQPSTRSVYPAVSSNASIQPRRDSHKPDVPVDRMPIMYRKMQAIARKQTSWGYSYTGGGNKLFYEQARFMETFEDDYDGASYYNRYYPTYQSMDDYNLRCYFTWRTRLRKALQSEGEPLPEAPASFVFMHVYELLCGVGTTTGLEGYEKLNAILQGYAGVTDSFDSYMRVWIHDYVIYHNLAPELLPPGQSLQLYVAVRILRLTEEVLLKLPKRPKQKYIEWPSNPTDEGLPASEELLDTLIALSRYRADRSRFFKDHRSDVATVCGRVIARMIDHCSKRRKLGLTDSFFGKAHRRVYHMFTSAVFWSDQPHEAATYDCGNQDVFTCDGSSWWHELPCWRTERSTELGNLLHTIDSRMRERSGDKHPLKPRKLPKYQAKFVEEEVEAFYAQREAEEAARIHIDRSALSHIRSAAAVTREALLTDDERADEAAPEPTQLAANKSVAPSPDRHLEPEQNPMTSPAPVPAPAASASTTIPGLSAEHCELLQALLDGGPVPASSGQFLSLAIDTINECFLDIVGDTVIEFDGDTPVLVEDYVEEVREALA